MSFAAEYKNEEKCFKKLVSIRFKNGFECDFCGCDYYWIRTDRRVLICKNCRKEVSPLANTMFHRSRLSLVNWFRIIYLVVCSPDEVITALEIQKRLKIGSYRTAWKALNKIRFAISHASPQKALEGLIEFDEIVLSGLGTEYRRISILGALELEGKNRLNLQMVRNPDEMNIKDYFKKVFKKNVEVITDPEKLYISNWLELNRIKQISSTDYYGKNFLNLHIILQDIKYGIKKGHHSVSPKYLPINLDEYVFIFNNNADRKKGAEKVLKYMIKTPISDFYSEEKKKQSLFTIIRGANIKGVNKKGAAVNSSS